MNKNYGPRRNTNGAGVGGRMVGQTSRDLNGKLKNGSVVNRGNSKVKWGNRRARYRDIRVAFGLAAG